MFGFKSIFHFGLNLLLKNKPFMTHLKAVYKNWAVINQKIY